MITTELALLCCFSFAAGFIDAIVGGGGLVQTPAILFIYPQYPVATLLGTTKIPSFSGTAMAAVQYARRVHFNWPLLVVTGISAFIAATGGASLASVAPSHYMRPFILCVLIAVGLYTFLKKDFGQHTGQEKKVRYPLLLGAAIGLPIGFYDGLLGPGTGTFLILAFITIMGFDFLRASAYSKAVNVCSNLASLLYFGTHGHILWTVTLFMAISNLAGSFFGARLAMLKGNKLVRKVFLAVICATILRFAYDIFWLGK
ncbi:TSUP family transporter [Chitinophaga pendula]|uniref:sulfite exporter TauE/SafE family protein n=1 Tax=Chitinophaga TaxID=79328 RepID=UPI000BAEFAB4|nr:MULTISPECIES: TSUP family transporter [Chitinophaga]ASZ13554.1 hypothetical protein CK934_22670 [Chitinophaga sp. MD30]UCJ08813.1 TSUP family transporter [Chitinophaga pendula]